MSVVFLFECDIDFFPSNSTPKSILSTSLSSHYTPLNICDNG